MNEDDFGGGSKDPGDNGAAVNLTNGVSVTPAEGKLSGFVWNTDQLQGQKLESFLRDVTLLCKWEWCALQESSDFEPGLEDEDRFDCKYIAGH